ncbi:MAG: glycerophosphodiester phosphodiesterase family protein [Chlamydiae bacterium]|nr:glycerophosphodiester phosphodiesterase family protein [Chlamydiota bacterium]
MENTHSIEVQAHRGARDSFPENTLPAFEAAWKMGSGLIELDIQITSDGIPVIYHDFAVNPDLCSYMDRSSITKAPLIRSLSLAEVKNIDCGSKPDPRFKKQALLPGTQIPTLEELIDAITSSSEADNTLLNIELKRDPRNPALTFSADDIVTKVLSVIEKKGFSKRVRYCSFDPDILVALRKKEPDATLAFLFDEMILEAITKHVGVPGLDYIISMATAQNIQIISPDHNLLKDTSMVSILKSRGFKVVTWTSNDPERWQELIDLGVDGIITDRPKALLSFLEASSDKLSLSQDLSFRTTF